MVKRRLVSPLPNLSSIRLISNKLFLKLVLGGLFLCLKPFKLRWLGNTNLALKLTIALIGIYLFLNYQPTFAFPPVKQTPKVLAADNEQTPTVSAESVNQTFQLPHPGYLSTYFSSYHPGVDIATGLGMPVKPISAGTVIEAGFNLWGLGLVVEIDHENGYKSLYAHMGRVYVSKGQKVTTSDYVGDVGLTGHTTGPHTHLEISFDNQKVNPLTILPEIRKHPTEDDFIAQGGSYGTQYEPEPTPTPSPKPTQTPKPSELETLVNDQSLQPKTESILDKVVVNPDSLESNKSMDLALIISDSSLQSKPNYLLSKLSLF
jgi:hypothetical protein